MLELLRGRLQFSPAVTEAFILPSSGTTHVQLPLCDDMWDNMAPQRNRGTYLSLGMRGFDLVRSNHHSCAGGNVILSGVVIVPLTSTGHLPLHTLYRPQHGPYRTRNTQPTAATIVGYASKDVRLELLLGVEQHTFCNERSA